MNPRVRRGNRGHNNYNGNNQRRTNNTVSRNTVLDSLGPAGKLRGTAFQLMEKYLAAAKDAHSTDRVLEENCLQHAEHYMRLNALAIAAEQQRFNQNQPQPRPMSDAEDEAAGEAPAENIAQEETAEREVPAEQIERIDPARQPQPEVVEENPVKAAERARAEKPARYAETDLSVPVAMMSEKAREVQKERTLSIVRPAPSESANGVAVVKRRGRPAKKKIEITAS